VSGTADHAWPRVTGSSPPGRVIVGIADSSPFVGQSEYPKSHPHVTGSTWHRKYVKPEVLGDYRTRSRRTTHRRRRRIGTVVDHLRHSSSPAFPFPVCSCRRSYSERRYRPWCSVTSEVKDAMKLYQRWNSELHDFARSFSFLITGHVTHFTPLPDEQICYFLQRKNQ